MQKYLALMALVVALTGGIAGCRTSRSAKKIRKELAVPHRDGVDSSQKPAADTSVAKPTDLHADSLAVIRQAVGQLQTNHIDFKTFSAHTRVHYEESDGKDYEFNAVIHIQKDSMIWLSITATLGIEAFRVLITPDSVKVLDKLKKIARVRSVEYLQEAFNMPVDFKTVQDLLIGNPVFFDTSAIEYYKKGANTISLVSLGNLFKNYLTMNTTDNTLSHCKLDDIDPTRARTCDLNYDDYSRQDSSWFSSYRRISVIGKTKTDIEMEYKQYKFNEVLSFSFSIPKNYKRR